MIGKDFTTWMRDMLAYDFKKDVDYVQMSVGAIPDSGDRNFGSTQIPISVDQ